MSEIDEAMALPCMIDTEEHYLLVKRAIEEIKASLDRLYYPMDTDDFDRERSLVADLDILESSLTTWQPVAIDTGPGCGRGGAG